ncbi:MAG: hypothetical protein LC623_01830 [Halobacteriales archaeon]|nr:hypothetical protein [Halobacteriales archaeon]
MGRTFLITSAAALLVMAALPVTNADQCLTSSGCEFWDNNFHEYILYTVDTTKIDVLIVPAVTPNPTRDTQIVEKAVDGWKNALANCGCPLNQIQINRYTLGTDNVPQDALLDPEIVVVTSEHNPFLLFGIGEQLPLGICTQRGGAVQTFPSHDHDGATIASAECKQGGMTCVALNTNFLLGGVRRMYDLVSHEFGHCLGIGHVGDALDFDAKVFPVHDIMSYQYDATHVHCVSNLNLNALSGVYADLLGQPGQLDAGDYIQMVPSSHTNVACANP